MLPVQAASREFCSRGVSAPQQSRQHTGPSRLQAELDCGAAGTGAKERQALSKSSPLKATHVTSLPPIRKLKLFRSARKS